eukprot:TRINITY_DN66792_c8_g1_i5.p2 TRINITY_DN66792_c8_g1~~TRINITY_DN66792_c8_g1_i5.p2  ORF type:complete len:108 (+),score=0.63 TRINITY_DN66792_c8_g1_i5:193-516(+)
MRNAIPRVLWMKPKPQAGWGRLASQSSIVKMTYMPPILTGGAAPQDVAHVASLGGISEQLNTLEDLAAVRAHLVGLLSAYNLCKSPVWNHIAQIIELCLEGLPYTRR